MLFLALLIKVALKFVLTAMSIFIGVAFSIGQSLAWLLFAVALVGGIWFIL